MFSAIFPFIGNIVNSVVANKYPDKAKIAEAMSQSDVKSSAAEIQDLISGASRWRKKVAYASMLYFLLYSILYYIIPQVIELWGEPRELFIHPQSEASIHSMYISAGLVTTSMIGREIVKLVRAWRG